MKRRMHPYELERGVMRGPTFLCRRANHCRELDHCRAHRDLMDYGPRMRVDGRWLSPIWASRMLWTKAGSRRNRGAQDGLRRRQLRDRILVRIGRYDDVPF